MKSLFIAISVVLFVSCNADDDPVFQDFREANELEIADYINQNNLDATRTASGLYYVIDEPGEGAAVTATSDVTVKYKGYFTDGSPLEENTDGFSINLQQTIPGWIEGLQFFNEGGSGMLLIPSHLAYGSSDRNSVPAGSVLIFEFELIDYDAINRQEILDYIANNELEAIESETGLFYVIEEPGTGEQPTGSSNITVTYSGYFTDGDIFDESDDDGISFYLDQVIAGWEEGMQYFKEGGSGKLLIPSSLAYGRYGKQAIPGGAVVIFDVNLISIN